MYLRNSLPPAPPPKDDESVASRRQESLVATLVDELEALEAPTVSAVSMSSIDSQNHSPSLAQPLAFSLLSRLNLSVA